MSADSDFEELTMSFSYGDDFDDDADLYYDDVFKEEEDVDEPYDDVEEEDGYGSYRSRFQDDEDV